MLYEKKLTGDTQGDYYLTLVIPAYNEEKRLDVSLSKIITYFFSKGYKAQILVVDDGSQDATGDIVKKYSKMYPNIRLIKNTKTRGKGYSVKRGVLSSSGKFVFFADSDLSTPIEEVSNLLYFLEGRYDIVVGSRALPTSNVLVRERWLRDRMGKFFGVLVRLLAVPGIMDSQCGFKGFTRLAAKEIFKLQQLDGFSFDVEILFIARKLGLEIKEVGVHWVNSAESKVNLFEDPLKMFLDLFKIRWSDFKGKYDVKNEGATDIILIYPPLSVNERYGRNLGNIGGQQPPLGIACLASYLRKEGMRPILIDALAQNSTNKDIADLILRYKPRAVGLSSLTVTFHRAIICAEELKKRFPDLLIIIGGHHASIMPQEVIKENPCFDIVCIGEGEITLTEILQRFDNHTYKEFMNSYALLNSIKGICYRRGEEVVITERRELIKDLDNLPFPARDLFKMEKYRPLPNQYKRLPLLHLTAIRGCPFSCSFCSNNAVYGRNIRYKSPRRLLEEIKHLIKDYSAKDISFWDDTLTVNNKWLREVCELILKEKLDITWTCYASVKTVNREILSLMKMAGCWNIFFGFEAGNQRLLDNIDKGITLDQIRQVNRWCEELGIEVRASFMIALPGETPELCQKTIDFAKELNPDYAQFCITTPFPKTKLFEEAHKYGILDMNFSKYSIWEPVFVPFGYKNEEEILLMEKKAMREFYFRLPYLIKRIRKIKSLEDIVRHWRGLKAIIGFRRQCVYKR